MEADTGIKRIRTASVLVAALAICIAAPAARAAGVVQTCDEASLQAALSGGGLVTFACSGEIALTSTLVISLNTSIDGSGQAVTLDGSNNVRVLQVNSGATLSLNNVTIAKGFASGEGGGILSLGTLIVNGSTFSGNNSGAGGAIYNQAGTLTISNSTFSSNTAVNGGAIYAQPGTTLTISNSTFSGNTSGLSGGAIVNDSSAFIVSSTFSGNSAADAGAIVAGSTTVLEDTILAKNSGGDCFNAGGTITDGGYNLSDDASCGFSAAGSKNSDSSINLGTLANGVFPLNPGSDAIGAIPAGTNGCATSIVADQRGVARPGSLNGNCSIGAYEYVPAPTFTINDCTSDSQLQTAVRTGGRIVFACSGDIKLTRNLFIESNTAVDATGYNVTLDGQQMVEVFGVSSFEGPPVTLRLNNVTVANGKNGGDASADSASAVVVITNSTFSGNTFSGIHISAGGSGVITNSTFSGNTYDGIDISGGSGASAIITNSTFSGNGDDGIQISDGSAVITNSTFSGNSAGIENDGGAVISNSTFSGNTDGIDNTRTVVLENTILANNADLDCGNDSGATITDAGHNLDDDGTCGLSSAKHSLSNNKNANLGSLSSNGGVTQTIPLLYPSVAIDAIPLGTNGCGLSSDQRGLLRPQGAACDIGAYEANQIPVAFSTDPANVSYSVGSVSFSSAQAPFLVVGGQYTIATTSLQSGGTGTQFLWQNWSDNGALSHTVTIPASPASYTAKFQTQYLLTTGVNAAAGGTVSPASGYFDSGSLANLSATANLGYVFSGWTGRVANASSALTTVTMTGPETVTANFTQTAILVPASQLTVTLRATGYNKNTGVSTFNYTITNKSTTASIAGPVQVVMTNPTTGAVNNGGTAAGYPYWTINSSIPAKTTVGLIIEVVTPPTTVPALSIFSGHF